MQPRSENRTGKRQRPPFQKISTDELRLSWEKFSATFSYLGDRCTALAAAIINRYLGKDWIEQYVEAKSRDAGYLRLDLAAPLQEKLTALMRYYEFAETLLNLQDVEGLEVCLDRLFEGNVESACAELDVARLLYSFDLKFKFVRPKQVKTEDYDFEIFYPDGFKVVADAKCKFESTPVRPESIKHSLQDARRQLPKNAAGIIFVKVPEGWIRDISIARGIVKVAQDFMHGTDKVPGTDRVKSVKFYAPVTEVGPVHTIRLHLHREVSNPKFPERDWDMFTRIPRMKIEVAKARMSIQT